MNGKKASGPNSFPASFFQKYWDVVGESVMAVINRIFSTGNVPQGMNKALLCLISKVKELEYFSQLRPISLCNVLMKLVTKIVANRLQPLMHKLVGTHQSSFIKGRLAADNVISAQEVIHSLRMKAGSKCGMVVKVDLEKAYDRIDWDFLRLVLAKMRFKPHL